MYKIGEKFILHSDNGLDYDIEIVSINPCRPLEERYGVDMYCEGEYYGDVYFCGEDFLNKCQKISTVIVEDEHINFNIPEIYGVNDELIKKYQLSIEDIHHYELVVIDNKIIKNRYLSTGAIIDMNLMTVHNAIFCFENSNGKHVVKVC